MPDCPAGAARGDEANQHDDTQGVGGSIAIAVWIATNLAHGLLLTGQTAQAQKLYLECGNTLAFEDDPTTTFAAEVRKDFAKMHALGITSPQMQKIDNLLADSSSEPSAPDGCNRAIAAAIVQP